jgi:hypothetical protein
MRDLRSDWKRWSRAERVSAVALIAAFIIRGSSIVGVPPSPKGATLMILPLGATLLSPRAFKALGIEEIAYVKPIVDDTGSTYAIHAADGTRLAIVEDRLVAFATIRRNDLEPASLH